MADPAPLRVVCPSCGVSALAPARLVGKNVRCQRCAATFRVVAPTAAGPAPTLAEGPAPSAPTVAEVAPAPGRAEWRPGDVVLGLYEVAGLLGQGGMGRVYRVRHRSWGVDLAVKVPLPSALEAAGGPEAFEREAETWVNLLLNPHVVSCYYVRRLEGLPHVFAEFVDGGTLGEAIRAGRLRTLDAILDAAIQFAWGLHDAHEQGLVHRDVKPANVMLTAEGVAKVTDFGLAGARIAAAAVMAGAGDTTAMAAGGGGGTPAYMSPEQWAGRPLSRRTDVWSWGLSVLEAFRGQRTWPMGPAAARVLEDALDAGTVEGLPAMPDVVAALLRRCFLAEPDGRPRTMAEAADTLIAVYEAETGRPYPRSRPAPGRQTAATLNNRAVSLLDLGRGDADALWTQALAAEPQHLESSYNQGVHAWTHGRSTDAEVVARVDEAVRASGGSARGPHLRGSLLLAMGDFRRAAASFAAAAQAGPAGPELLRERALALCALANSGGEPSAWTQAAACLEAALAGSDEQAVDVAALARMTVARAGLADARRLFAERAGRHPELPSEVGDAIGRFLPGHERRAVFKDLTETATAIAVTPDGGRVLAATGSETLRAWNAATGRAEAGLTVPDLRIRCLALAPDGQSVLVGGEGGPPQVHDLGTGRLLRALQRHPGATTALAVSADGRWAAGGSTDRIVRVWELATGRAVHAFEGHTEGVTAVAIASDGALVVSGGLDGSARLWDVAAVQARGALLGHRGRVTAVALDLRGAILVSGGEDGTVRLWSSAASTPLRVLAGATGPISALALSADGQRCVAASLDRSLRQWDLGRGRLRALVRLEAPIVAAGGRPESGLSWASCGTSIQAVRLDAVWRRPSHALARPVSVTDVQHRDAAFRQRLTEARQSLTRGDLGEALKLARQARAVPGHERSAEALNLWDDVTSLLPRKGLESAWELAALEGHRDPVVAVCVNADGTRALSGDLTGQVRSWDLLARRPLAVLDGHDATVSAVAVTPDERWGVSASWDRTLRLWPLRDGGAPRVLRGHGDYVNAAAVSPDGRTLLSASSDQTLRLWELPGGRALEVLEGHESQVSACAFGPDGRYALSAGWDATVRVWDLETHSCVSVLQGHEGSVGTVAVSPDGRQAASGGLDGTIRIWDLRTRRALRALSGHAAEVTAVAFFLDGRHLASCSRDKTVRIWDLGAGRHVQALPHTGAVLCLAPLPSGSALVTGGTDLVLRLWRLDWEADERPAPGWDEKARTHLATLVTLRAPAGAATARAADVDALVKDLRRRGFGGVQRETVAARVDELAANPGAVTSAWDEIRKAAPAAAARVAAVQAARRVRRRLPPRQAVVAAAGLLLAAVLGVVVFRPRQAELGLSRHQMARARDDLAIVKLWDGGGACADGYDRYLELSHERVVGEETLACLVRLQQPGLVESYFSGLQLDDQDGMLAVRKRRLAVSFMAALGAPATRELCHALETGNDQARWVAARALAAQAGETAAECLAEGTRHADPAVRAAATGALRLLIGRDAMTAARAWELLQPLTRDPEPAVRREAAGTLAIFSWKHASTALGALERDPDPGVAAAAKLNLDALRNYRLMNPDKPY